MLLQMALFISFYDQYSIIYMFHNFFIHSSVSGHLNGFHVLDNLNSAAMNIGVHVSLWIIVLSGYIPKSGIALSNSNSVFSFWSHLHSVFHSGCICYCLLLAMRSQAGNLFSLSLGFFLLQSGDNLCLSVDEGGGVKSIANSLLISTSK